MSPKGLGLLLRRVVRTNVIQRSFIWNSTGGIVCSLYYMLAEKNMCLCARVMSDWMSNDYDCGSETGNNFLLLSPSIHPAIP